jgi:RNA recognition motif-containing protein
MEIFGNFGNVIFCDFPMDKQKSWINTSMAYVEFEKLEEADECVKKMNGGMW